MNTEIALNMIGRLPKVELHLHLAGSIRPVTCLQLLEKSGGKVSITSEQDLCNYLRYENFHDFLDKYSFLSGLLVNPGDFELVTRELINDLVNDNVKYAEITLSPHDHVRKGVDYREMLNAVTKAVEEGESTYGIKINYIIDLVRNYGPGITMDILEQTIGINNPRVVAIGLGGDESSYSLKEFSEVFTLARRKGLYSTVHAGETTGPESIWEAIIEMNVQRIGHGISAAQDQALLRQLREMKIPLEICISGNVATKVVKDIKQHPVAKFMEKQLIVAIGTDNPVMFNTSLSNEYNLITKNFDLTMGELRGMIIDSLQAAFLSNIEKHKMIRNFSEEFHQLKKEFFV